MHSAASNLGLHCLPMPLLCDTMLSTLSKYSISPYSFKEDKTKIGRCYTTLIASKFCLVNVYGANGLGAKRPGEEAFWGCNDSEPKYCR